MANKFINIVTICLLSMIIEAITAAPVDSNKEHVGKGLSDTFLKILNNNAPTINGYQGGKIIEVKKITDDEHHPLFEATLRLEPKCAKGSSCLPEICSLTIYKEPTTSRLMAIKPMTCYHDFSTNVLNLVDGRIRREIGDENNNDGSPVDEYVDDIYYDDDLYST